MKTLKKRRNVRETVLDNVRNDPGITAADIPIKQRGQLRGLERDGLIECRGYGWYACRSQTSQDAGKDGEQATMFVIAIGNPFDGIRLFGQGDGTPFLSHDEAAEHAETEFDNGGGDWWIVPIRTE
jgi:hypothetical protein